MIAETKIREQKESEIALLKNQINPHFLFNTLNNIDSLIKSALSKASDVLINLSELLRYMIYKTQDEKVPLNLEINSIRDYFEIQKIQYSNKEIVMFSIEGNSENVKIAPMLFIPLNKIQVLEKGSVIIGDKRIPIGEIYKTEFSKYIESLNK